MFLIEQMTRLQVEAQIQKYPVAILPIGSCEQHGPHLPLATDSILAEALARRISQKTGALVYPTLHFSYSWVWRDIPGTMSISTVQLQSVLTELAGSAQRSGIRLLVFLNGHEANNNAIKYAIRQAQDVTSVQLLRMFYPGIGEVYETEMESPTWGSGMFHACEFETSLMLAARPELVDMSLAVAEYPQKPPLYGVDTSSLGAISKSGVYGDATLATREKGERMFTAFAEKAASIIALAYNQEGD